MAEFSVEIPVSLPMHVVGPKASRDFETLVDTGSTYVVISWEDAFRLGYEPWRAPRAPIGTGSGMIEAPLIELNRVEVLGFKRERVKALVKDLSDVGIIAILGWSFLNHFSFLIDPKEGILKIEDP